ncbi:YfiR family protein [Nibricoccus sp. IMCC34717]|uniref:YfiR family protein n=1 Tax=Nibricoccus sp. IMCC34717 TaxID=3034021 RepID=UPI00384C080E
MTRRSFLLRSLLVSAVVSTWLTHVRAANETRAVSEARLKAAYLLKFTQYVTWPPESFTDSADPLKIGLPADSALFPEITREAANLRAPRPIVVIPVANSTEAAKCHVVYVGEGEVPEPGTWLSAFENLPILVVSDWSNAIQSGATIKLLQEARSLRFEVNQSAAEAAQLAFNPEMLRYAKVIHKRPKDASP